MADTPAPEPKGGSMGFLGRKIGPVPIWLIGVGAVGVWYWWTHYGPGKTTAAAVTTQQIEVAGPPGARGAAGARGARGKPGKPGKTVVDKIPFRKVKVPDVEGQRYERGAAEVTKAGLIAQRDTPYVGIVRRESPHAGTRVQRGTVVTLSGRSGGGGTWPPGTGPDAGPAAVGAASGQGGIYDAWTSAEQPDLQRVYAPQTNGAIYGS